MKVTPCWTRDITIKRHLICWNIKGGKNMLTQLLNCISKAWVAVTSLTNTFWQNMNYSYRKTCDETVEATEFAPFLFLKWTQWQKIRISSIACVIWEIHIPYSRRIYIVCINRSEIKGKHFSHSIIHWALIHSDMEFRFTGFYSGEKIRNVSGSINM